jgi:hypothetical protein
MGRLSHFTIYLATYLPIHLSVYLCIFFHRVDAHHVTLMLVAEGVDDNDGKQS